MSDKLLKIWSGNEFGGVFSHGFGGKQNQLCFVDARSNRRQISHFTIQEIAYAPFHLHANTIGNRRASQVEVYQNHRFLRHPR